MGVCYSVDRQKALEEAYELINGEILPRLEPDSNNIHNKNGIVVFISRDNFNYKIIGYIASKLTSFVHFHLNDASLHVYVKSIRFRTTFKKIGFYISMTILYNHILHYL